MKVPSKIELPIKIENGKFATNLETVKTILTHYEGCVIDVVFLKRTNRRTKPQNRYYWGVIVPIFNNCIKTEWNEIWNKEDIHFFLKSNCNYVEHVIEETGEIVRIIKSTTDNSTVEQEEFHEKCRRLASDFFNTNIPLPNEETNFEF